jgi:hypothetical protein
MKVSETFIAPLHRRAGSFVSRAGALLAAAWRRRRLRTIGVLALGSTVLATLIAAALAAATLTATLSGALSVAACGGLIRGDNDLQTVAQAVGAIDDDTLAG